MQTAALSHTAAQSAAYFYHPDNKTSNKDEMAKVADSLVRELAATRDERATTDRLILLQSASAVGI